ncbi:MAG: molecular chaperone TorD family protein [Chloroflexota bacterium]|nr:molecular chaperone TorD family protein [Chloroflexota bacterium]
MTGPVSQYGAAIRLPEGLAENRARTYGVLSLAYARPVDRPLVELLRPWGSMLEEEPPQEALPGVMRRGLRKLDSWLKGQGSELTKEVLTALEVEFTRLFRGLHPLESPPPPYESVYGDGGLLYGPSTLQVARTYRRFRLKGKNNEPPDHIALELDFMRFLCQKEALARRKGEEARDWLQEEGAFLEEHLVTWVPALCRKIRGSDTMGFYSGLADVTEGWLSCDRRIIRGLLGQEGRRERRNPGRSKGKTEASSPLHSLL